MADELDYVVLPRKPVADGATGPNPGKPFALAWSTAFNDIAWWDDVTGKWVNNNPLATEARPGLISAEDFTKLKTMTTGAVLKVFGRVGNVAAVLGDYAASLVSNDSSVTGATVKEALQTLATLIAAVPGQAVSSVHSRTGAVVAALGDYAASLISNNSSVSGATVKDALQTLASAIAAVPAQAVASVHGRTGAVVAAASDYAASLVSNNSTVSGATVKDALQTLASAIAAIPAAPVASVFGRVGAVAAAVNDYTSNQIKNTSTGYNNTTYATLTAVLDFISTTVSNLQSVAYVTFGATANLPNERAIAVAPSLSMVDGGAGGALTFAQVMPPNAQFGTAYTLALTDDGKQVLCYNAAAIAFTIPANAAVPLAVGARSRVIQTHPTGTVSFTLPSGVQLLSDDGQTYNGPVAGVRPIGRLNGTVHLLKTLADQWLITSYSALEVAGASAGTLATGAPQAADRGTGPLAARNDHSHPIAVAGVNAGLMSAAQATQLAAAASAGGKYAIAVGGAVSVAVTHNLNTRDVTVAVYDAATFEEAECDVVRTSVNVVTLNFVTAPAAASLRCVVQS